MTVTQLKRDDSQISLLRFLHGLLTGDSRDNYMLEIVLCVLQPLLLTDSRKCCISCLMSSSACLSFLLPQFVCVVRLSGRQTGPNIVNVTQPISRARLVIGRELADTSVDFMTENIRQQLL